MFGSYGSYSSMSAASAPIDIASGNLRRHEATCAFPSWPRRDSLSSEDNERPATSYLSDDDLFLSDPFEDDARSVSSSGSSTTASPAETSPFQQVTRDAELLQEIERERVAMQRAYVQQIISEKEKRRQATKKRRSNSGGSKKSPKSKLAFMTPISETGE